MKKAIKNSLLLIISFVISNRLISFFEIQNNILISFLDIIGLLVVYYLIKSVLKEKRKVNHILSAVFSVLLCISFVV